MAKAISTFEARYRAKAREKVEMLAKNLGFTLAELEKSKRKQAPSTKVYPPPLVNVTRVEPGFERLRQRADLQECRIDAHSDLHRDART